MKNLRELLFSQSVFSKQYIADAGLYAATIDDHFLYEKDGHALINAFKNLDSKTINWCNTFDIMDATKTTNIHVFDCTYENLLTGYLEYDKSIPYWDHILYNDSFSAFVLHTAHDHIIYVGSKDFINEATQRNNHFIDGWLSVYGQAFSDPELIDEYGLRDKINTSR